MTALAATASPDRHNILRGKPVADEILTDVRSGVGELSSAGWPVKLVSMTIGDVPEAALYVRNRAMMLSKAAVKACGFECGLEQRLCRPCAPCSRWRLSHL
jgi:5,10-methylene-tetrahydrofolate dehydrogenase/methenyl tetrahydrofolate cyclohydrolase